MISAGAANVGAAMRSRPVNKSVFGFFGLRASAPLVDVESAPRFFVSAAAVVDGGDMYRMGHT